jgi:hypothetical protein
MRVVIAVAMISLAAPVARADDEHLIYVEAGGKAGVYGVGYELSITPLLSLGAAASYAVIRDQHVATGSPYLHATLLRGKRNALFGELGLVLAYSRIPSPVMTWEGMSDVGAGGVGALGWERTWKHGIVTRVQGSVLVGEGGAAPWFGVSFGWRP